MSGASAGSGSTAPPVTPTELLDAADQLLRSPVPGLGNLWPRACALLIRTALELILDQYWARVLPEAADCGMRPQLLLLPLYVASGPTSADAASISDAVSLAREAWLGLAGAAHHHAYELAPNASELRGWHTAVTQLAVLLANGQPDLRQP
jgi:hypothetical protein